jgi:hypothetical protein
MCNFGSINVFDGWLSPYIISFLGVVVTVSTVSTISSSVPHLELPNLSSMKVTILHPLLLIAHLWTAFMWAKSTISTNIRVLQIWYQFELWIVFIQ